MWGGGGGGRGRRRRGGERRGGERRKGRRARMLRETRGCLERVRGKRLAGRHARTSSHTRATLGRSSGLPSLLRTPHQHQLTPTASRAAAQAASRSAAPTVAAVYCPLPSSRSLHVHDHDARHDKKEEEDNGKSSLSGNPRRHRLLSPLLQASRVVAVPSPEVSKRRHTRPKPGLAGLPPFHRCCMACLS